jgi:hypothetical protein
MIYFFYLYIIIKLLISIIIVLYIAWSVRSLFCALNTWGKKTIEAEALVQAPYINHTLRWDLFSSYIYYTHLFYILILYSVCIRWELGGHKRFSLARHRTGRPISSRHTVMGITTPTHLQLAGWSSYIFLILVPKFFRFPARSSGSSYWVVSG